MLQVLGSVGKAVQVVNMVLMLLPALISAMRSLEEAIPGKGKGELKLAAVRLAVENAYSLIEGAKDSFKEVWPAIESTVNGLVGLFNTAGTFKKEE